MQGPFNLNINEEIGLLVAGFDTPPMLLMGHDKPYVGGRIEEQGLRKEKDVYAYLYDITVDLPAGARRLVDRPLPEELTGTAPRFQALRRRNPHHHRNLQ